MENSSQKRSELMGARQFTGDPYRGINTIMLWLARRANGYAGNKWLTFRQALALGGGVRKGETGHLIVKKRNF